MRYMIVDILKVLFFALLLIIGASDIGHTKNVELGSDIDRVCAIWHKKDAGFVKCLVDIKVIASQCNKRVKNACVHLRKNTEEHEQCDKAAYKQCRTYMEKLINDMDFTKERK